MGLRSHVSPEFILPKRVRGFTLQGSWQKKQVSFLCLFVLSKKYRQFLQAQQITNEVVWYRAP